MIAPPADFRGGLGEVREWALHHIQVNPTPDFHIGPDDDHQLQRWFIVPRNRISNVYLHRFLRSDDDRALHDHPWLHNTSWLLSGEYLEHLQDGSTATRHEGEIITRHGLSSHRVELVSGPVVTLFFTGPVVRNWGFYCPGGWVPQQVYRERGCGS